MQYSADPTGEKIDLNQTEATKIQKLALPLFDEVKRKKSGKRSVTRSDTGRYVRAEIPKNRVTDLAFDATLRAAAPYQRSRKASGNAITELCIEKQDLRQKIREKKIGNLIIFVLDHSGSMAREVEATKTAILSLLLDAYQRRDHIGLVYFGGIGAGLVLAPTKSVDLAQKKLPDLYLGGRSPLTHGLEIALRVIKEQAHRKQELVPLLVLISDGKGNVSRYGNDPEVEALSVAREIRKAKICSIGIDTMRKDFFSPMLTICKEMDALYLRPDDLKADSITSVVKSQLRYNR